MKNIIELVKRNRFKKKSVGNKTQQVSIVETPTDCIGWVMADNSEKPFISNYTPS
jgi:hypothetical protein